MHSDSNCHIVIQFYPLNSKELRSNLSALSRGACERMIFLRCCYLNFRYDCFNEHGTFRSGECERRNLRARESERAPGARAMPDRKPRESEVYQQAARSIWSENRVRAVARATALSSYVRSPLFVPPRISSLEDIAERRHVWTLRLTTLPVKN